MFAKGDNSWRLQKFGVRGWHKPPADLVEICVEKDPKADLCVVGKTDMVTDQWFHFAGVHDHPQAKLYVNGVLEKAETFDGDWKSGDHPVGIGNQSQFPERGPLLGRRAGRGARLNVVQGRPLDQARLREPARRAGAGEARTRAATPASRALSAERRRGPRAGGPLPDY